MILDSANQLIQGKRDIPLPLVLTIADEFPLLECKQALRILPGKRMTCYAQWGTKKVVAKLFFDAVCWYRHGKEDECGVRILTDAGILTPPLLFSGQVKAMKVYAVIFEYIEGSKNLTELWPMLGDFQQKLSVLKQTMDLLAQQHRQGIIHQDLHFDNFLLKGDRLYQLDGAEVIQRFLKRPLTITESYRHLSLFLSQLSPVENGLIEPLFSYYLTLRGWNADIFYLTKFIKLLSYQRDKYYHYCLKKVFRECTKVVYKHDFTSVLAVMRKFNSEYLGCFLKSLDDTLSTQEDLLKNGHSSTVGKAYFEGNPVVIKRYNVKGIHHYLKICLKPSRAAKSWRNAHFLRLLGIATAEPIAFLEKRFGFLRGKAYFITRFVPGVTLTHYFASAVSDGEKAKMATKVMALFQQLFLSRLSHGDLKASNFLVDNGEIKLIDLDSLCRHRTRFGLHRAWEHDWARFMRNWEQQPEIGALFRGMGGRERLFGEMKGVRVGSSAEELEV